MSRLRTAALVAMVAGAAGSVGLMLWTGQRNRSSILMVMFAGWVLAPYVALALADRAAPRWPERSRTMLYRVMLIVALGSLATFATAAVVPTTLKPAFLYLVVPPGSFLLMAIAAFIAGRTAR